MRHEAFEPGLRWIRRSAGRDAESEGWVHDQKWHEHRADTEEQSGQQGRLHEPAIGDEGDEHERIQDADRVMGDPAYRAFQRTFRSVGDARVREDASRHVANPTPDQAIVGRRMPNARLTKTAPRSMNSVAPRPTRIAVKEYVVISV